MRYESDRYTSPHSLHLSRPRPSWVSIPVSSFIITSAVFVIFVLDLVSPGYGSFAFIPDLRPQISTLTADIRSDLESLTRSKSSPTPTKKNPKADKSNKCQTLLDSYNPNAKCRFEPTNYSNISQ
ncbi:hypothetical protein [Calothrix sp. UHCC 0171]|uniref:hypothetical protein n=1 Tax=Calothrix sp. UHCC 0171 TaxID=3110245 RepID=UPI002B21BA40|nr:hypothetical protein [Calothrix sp. UHCC 0171]MEA5574773.1 hypothetical protein [Calothrix sp. UHCC 0171]